MASFFARLVFLFCTLPFARAAAAAMASSQPVVPPPADEDASKFFVTAITARDGRSTIECWQLDAPVQLSASPGTKGASNTQLGDVDKLAYTVLPADFDGGLHNAPAAQYVAFLSGHARITVPGSDDVADIHGGADGLIIVTDIASASTEGHRTTYPGKTPTAALQIPFKDGQIPPHKVVSSGPCPVHQLKRHC
ncbi:hypothetical protein CDD83_1983 [Cordyceps sp. RAO-2017]|nr:hypothetical protein CDD83_1983 [Cordyceps sp. RAO-2017]